ncbi:transmembrane protein 223 [Sitodiplosis mosellana]|uniref:transmembrane protein 223 n=1 Tax=Sitodiplosis mosellana TaxID=263140 RepID=UPI002444B541|nr:transmembrane protein 223 [Sitodiplosis mosellana]
MNRLLFNRSILNSSFLVRNYTVKPLTPPLRNIVKEPSRLIYKPIVYTFSTNGLKQFCRSNGSYAPLNIDTNLAKDVIVFKYNNPRYFKMMNIFGLAQFFFWLICSEFTLSNLRNTPINEGAPNFADLPLYLRVNLGENKYKYGLAIGCFMFGLVILGFVWTFTLRNVRYLILRKGGNKVAFVTYGPFGTNRIIDVPLNCVSAVTARESGASSLPIKVKSKRFHYLLDKQGEFTNPKLFDHVINVKRRI